MNISERTKKICVDFALKQQEKRMQACSDEYRQEQERQRHEVEADQMPLDEQCRMLEENGV